MNALRGTASLQNTPERIRKQATEMMQLQISPQSEAEDELEEALSLETMDDILVEQEDLADEISQVPTLPSTPPSIRRRRKPSDATDSLDFNEDAPRSLSFMEQETMKFPTYQKGARLSTLKMTATCRAIFLLTAIILVACAMLSHYTFLDKTWPEQETTAMTLSEKQVLLKTYLGDLDGGWSNVKVPAGGNPIDIVHLLHSQAIEDEQEMTR